MKYPTVLIAICMALFVVLSASAAPVLQNQPPAAGIVNANSNLRSGPGTHFDIVGRAPEGTAVEIAACNDDCTWYQLTTGEWIAAFLVDAQAPAEPQAATATPPPPAIPPSTAFTLTLVSWNVESGGALQNVVAERMAAFDGVDIWGLSEVNAIDAEAFEFGAEEGEGADFDSLLGTTGGSDRLLLIWDAERFERLDGGEMREIGESGRAPLWAMLRERATQQTFIVMVNHLHRSNEGIRHRQAQALAAWAGSQTLPVIALGDYNFDWNLPDGVSHDEGFDYMTAAGVWEWVRPAELVTTQCSGWPCRYNSILDFVFVAGPAREWNAYSEIVVVEGDFPDDFTTPDHRPVLAVLSTAVGAEPAPTVPVSPTAAAARPTTTPMPAQAACPQANRNANLRAGPGTNYSVVGGLQDGECVTIIGRNQAGDWYLLSSGAWVAAFLIDGAPAASTIPVVTVPTPTPALVAECDSSYPGLCIPPPPPDLDCTDISYQSFPVRGADPHNFDGDGDGIGCENPQSTPVEPDQPAPAPLPEPAPQQPEPECDPNYTDACIPIVSYDLDCGDVTARRFQSIGSDPHGFDGDGDGIACER
ncbi:MAG TPA: SH3 domain-containing protein [Caldilineaceae bacterium]|nr:SH3 domain-containing protein [Caldilineaceae bacterium]